MINIFIQIKEHKNYLNKEREIKNNMNFNPINNELKEISGS